MRKATLTIARNELVKLWVFRGWRKNERAHTQALQLQPGQCTTWLPPCTRHVKHIILFYCYFAEASSAGNGWSWWNVPATVALILTCFTMSSLTHRSFSLWQLRTVGQWCHRPRKQWFGHIYLFGAKHFQESSNWACSLSGCQDCRWPEAIRVSVYLGETPNDWTNMTRLGDWEVKKRAYLARRSNHRLLKWGGGSRTGEGVLMSLKMSLSVTTAAKDPPKHFTSIAKHGKVCR